MARCSASSSGLAYCSTKLKTYEGTMIINKNENPYLSIIVYSRNDNYYTRLKACINGILVQAERHHLRSELILVEWNPLSGRPLIKDVFPWPKRSNFCSVRIIVVPASIHLRYDHSDKYPMHHFVARNVGIRRARGKFILSITNDILFSDELMEYLASEELDKDVMYRIDRYDVKRDAALLHSLDQQLAYCQKNILVVNRRLESGFWGSTNVPYLHTNASGDFLLLSKDRWHLLHGFPETDVVGMHIDGALCYMAYLAGAKEEILLDPMRIYHIDHDSIWKRPEHNWLGTFCLRAVRPKCVARGLASLVCKFFPTRSRLDVMGIPHLSYAQYRSIVLDMISGKRSIIYNDDSWGLGQDNLDEYLVVSAEWEK